MYHNQADNRTVQTRCQRWRGVFSLRGKLRFLPLITRLFSEFSAFTFNQFPWVNLVTVEAGRAVLEIKRVPLQKDFWLAKENGCHAHCTIIPQGVIQFDEHFRKYRNFPFKRDQITLKAHCYIACTLHVASLWLIWERTDRNLFVAFHFFFLDYHRLCLDLMVSRNINSNCYICWSLEDGARLKTWLIYCFPEGLDGNLKEKKKQSLTGFLKYIDQHTELKLNNQLPMWWI